MLDLKPIEERNWATEEDVTALIAEVKSLRQLQVTDAMLSQVSRMNDRIEQLTAQLKSLRDAHEGCAVRNATLREGLKRHGSHLGGCWHGIDESECDCGLAELLKEKK